jgi:aconitate hydratase
MAQPFSAAQTLRELKVDGRSYYYYSLAEAEKLGVAGASALPYTLKVLLENRLRHAAEDELPGDIAAFTAWLSGAGTERELAFKPARMMIPESSGFPLLGDMAAMRDAIVRLGGKAQSVIPSVPIDFIVDHGVTVEYHGAPDAARRNVAFEIERNRERYEFMRWGQHAFGNMRLVPPGSGICHQVSIEYLARVAWTHEAGGRTYVYPESLLGMDSHTAMINCLGIAGWGVGGLEGGTAALGEPLHIQLPEVIGCKLSGSLKPGVTQTDLVLTVTQFMRRQKVVGKFVEFFGSAVENMPLPARASLANMTPEYGATMGYFPVDGETLRFLKLTARDSHQIALVEAYFKSQGLWRDAATPVPAYTHVVEIDLDNIEPCAAGPSRPNERVALPQVRAAFEAEHGVQAKSASVAGHGFHLHQGSVVLAAITSCTNTSNPSVMIAAGLLARNAVRRGLGARPWVKTSLSPGSRVVEDYLARTGLQQDLDRLGFHITGFGCMTCMGNSGPLSEAVDRAIEAGGLAVAAVLSGNRNFEGRIHPGVRANFLVSPPLVVAYALAGTIAIDLTREPLGMGKDGKPVLLADIWPDEAEIDSIVHNELQPQRFMQAYARIFEGPQEWQRLNAGGGTQFAWDQRSTFVRRPPFFDEMQRDPAPRATIRGARMLAMYGDMLTTDHISPIGVISKNTPAARYLESLGIAPKDFVSYAARRLNHDVMIRGTFANVRIRNELAPGTEGSVTRHMPSGDTLSLYDAAMRYRDEGVPLLVVGGAEYGAGSSRDWAAKGTRLLGVRAVIAESFERIHRTNLVGMGVLPLQFPPGVTRKTLKLNGSETFDFEDMKPGPVPRQQLQCTVTRSDGSQERILLETRLDTLQELEYYRHGGTFELIIRRRLAANAMR